MPRRSDARKCALQMLYLVDQNPDADIHWIRESLQEQLGDQDLMEFAWSLFCGVREQRSEIDESISTVAEHWRIDRMAPTDRNAIRMGFYEMRQIGTPTAVVLNESIELAREFGTENSPSFVNGVLDKLASQFPVEAPAEDESSA